MLEIGRGRRPISRKQGRAVGLFRGNRVQTSPGRSMFTEIGASPAREAPVSPKLCSGARSIARAVRTGPGRDDSRTRPWLAKGASRRCPRRPALFRSPLCHTATEISSTVGRTGAVDGFLSHTSRGVGRTGALGGVLPHSGRRSPRCGTNRRTTPLSATPLDREGAPDRVVRGSACPIASATIPGSRAYPVPSRGLFQRNCAHARTRAPARRGGPGDERCSGEQADEDGCYCLG
jgi:hypothetical protein